MHSHARPGGLPRFYFPAEVSPRAELVRACAFSTGHELAGPFRKPVDPDALNVPDYYRIVTRPMALDTIQAAIQ